MRKRIALIASLVVFFTVAVAFAADWRIQPFDSIISVNPDVLLPTHNWRDSCANLVGAPTLFYGNSPESWTSTSWFGQDHVVLARGVLSPSKGLLAFHYQNKLTLPVTLNFGIDPTSTATFGALIGVVAIATAPPYVVGSRAARGFLNKYVPISGLPTATPHRDAALNFSTPNRLVLTPYNISISPRLITQWTVPVGYTTSAEFELPSLSKVATFYLYACTAHCTSTYTTIASQDTFRSRGYFPNATFLIHYDYTPEYIDTGGSAHEVISDSTSTCVPNLPGNDPLDPTPGAFATLAGNFGVPVDIYGAAPFANHSQRFGINPRGGVPFVGAAWVQQLVDPKTDATVSPQAYVLPTQQPAPTPTAIETKLDSVMLGFDRGGGHTIIYILPGGNNNPVWIWDYVITPLPLPAHVNRSAEVNHAQH